MEEGIELRRRGFGPSALATPANAITVGRLVVVPFLIALILFQGPSPWSVTVWMVLAATDGLDGLVARRQGATRSGAFLDPLADKVLLLGALVALVIKKQLWWLPVALIAAREVSMSIYRVHAGRRGISIPARTTAKAKTWLQDGAVAFALFSPLAVDHPRIVGWVLWAAVALTLWTGVEYMIDAKRVTA